MLLKTHAASAIMYQDHRLLDSSEVSDFTPNLLLPTSLSFFSPLKRAKIDYGTPNQSLAHAFMLFVPRFLLAFAAAALAIIPTKKYAETEHENVLFYQLSAVTSALLINLYGINYLFNEIRHTQRVRIIMIVSTILGIMSTLPVFFMQQIVNKDDNVLAVLISTAITIGSMPMQILGFLEFFEHIYPQIQRCYFHYLSCNHDPIALKKIKVVDLFLQKLELGFKQRTMRNDIPDHLLQFENQELMRWLLIQDEITVNLKDSLLKKLGALIVGLLGVLLAEAVNLSFIKATYVSLTSNTNNLLAAILTTCVTLPSAILSAEFGFNAACSIYQSFFSTINQLFKANTCNDIIEAIKPSEGIHRVGELMTFMLVLLIVSCSYAPSVQFNRELFADSLSVEQLALINYATILGTLLFNSYVLNRISYSFLVLALDYVGDPQISSRVKFYKFRQSVLSGYEKMPKDIIVDGVENILGMNCSEEIIMFSL